MDDYRNNFSGEDRDRIIHDVNFVLIDDDQPSQITKRVKKEKKRFTFSLTRGGIALLVMVCLLTSTVFGFGGAMLANNLKASSSFGTRADFSTAGDKSGVTKTKNAVELSTDSDLTVEEIAALNANSVVEIKTESVATDNWMQQYVTEGAGSGVIISADGYIVTNNHVIEGSNKITVTLKNGSSYTASLVGRAMKNLPTESVCEFFLYNGAAIRHPPCEQNRLNASVSAEYSPLRSRDGTAVPMNINAPGSGSSNYQTFVKPLFLKSNSRKTCRS